MSQPSEAPALSLEERARELHDLIADPDSNAEACIALLLEWRLTAASAARRDALEEAAKVAETAYDSELFAEVGREISTAIRALADKEPSHAR
jgi:hypothetical protein